MEDLTTGSLSRHLLRTASFMLVTMLSQTLYFLVDLYWVGSLGKEAVAAVGIAGNLSFIVLACTQVLGVGTTTLISHASGARDGARARDVFHQSQWLAAAAAALFLIVAMAGRRALHRHARRRRATARLADGYLLWFIPALALQFVLATMAAALRGTGAFRTPMMVQVVTVAINIVLAPVLIFGWGTGAGVRRQRRRHRVARRDRRRRRLADACSSSQPEAFLRFSAADAPAAAGRRGAGSSPSACRPAPSSA